MLFDLFEKLRNESVIKRKQFAFFWALLFTGVIFMIWLTILAPDIFHSTNREADISAKERSFSSPTENISSTLSLLWQDFGGSIGEVIKLISPQNLGSVIEYKATSTVTEAEVYTSSTTETTE